MKEILEIVEMAEMTKIKKAVDELRHEFWFLREPTFNEVALKSGILNTRKLDTFLSFSGWKDESKEYVKKNAEYALNLAAWLSYKEKGVRDLPLMALCKKEIDLAHLDIIKHGQIILKHNPNVVPKVEPNQLNWPEATKAKWIQVFVDEPPASLTCK